MSLPFFDIIVATEERGKMVHQAEEYGYTSLFLIYPSTDWNLSLRLTKEQVASFNSMMQTIEDQHRLLQETTSVRLIPCFDLSVSSDILFSKQNPKTLHPFFTHALHFCRMDATFSLQQHLTTSRATGIIGSEPLFSFDFIHHRSSGLNHVVAKQLANQGMVYLFDLHPFYQMLENQTQPETKRTIAHARILGRMQQNIRLCKKYHVPYGIGSFATSWNEMPFFRDMSSLFAAEQIPQNYFLTTADLLLKKWL